MGTSLGLAGMIASALSMGSVAYLAAKSEREIYEAELARERQAIEMNRAEARELLSLYYQVKGLPEQDADRFAETLSKNPEQMLRALASNGSTKLKRPCAIHGLLPSPALSRRQLGPSFQCCRSFLSAGTPQ
jgi:VIT1/CCC1 family predicted Fe2+/Mn2+ transporter